MVVSRRHRCVLAAVALAMLGAPSPAPASPAASGRPASLPAFRGLFSPNEIPGPAAVRAWADVFHPPAGDTGRGTARPLLLDVPADMRLDGPAAAAAPFDASSQPSIAWGPLLQQSLEFLVLQHAVRAGFEENTWQKTIEGPFWDDYFNSVKNLCCWTDGDKLTTNYLFHPWMGSAAAFVFANNHRDSMVTAPGMNGTYWSAKGKQGVYAFTYSAYFEIGLVLSEAAIGNIGLSGEGMTWLDIVVTPSMGLLISAGEDALRATVIDRLDRWNHFWGATAAIFLNPTRSFANLMAFKIPWADPPWLTLRREAEARRRATAAGR